MTYRFDKDRLDSAVRARGKTWRQVKEETEISLDTIARMRRGAEVSAVTVRTFHAWLQNTPVLTQLAELLAS